MEKINVPALEIANKYKYVGFIGDDIIFKTKWELKFIDFLSKQKFGLAFANDLIHTAGTLPTHPFITSNLIKALGFFGCPGVGHHYFDNYWMEVINRVGTKQFFPEIIMEHLHPVVGKEKQDALYNLIEAKFSENYQNYKNYKINHFENDISKINKSLSEQI
jgi:hypothetical protein